MTKEKPTDTEAPSKMTRVTLNLPTRFVEQVIKPMAEERGMTLSDLGRTAFSREHVLYEESKKGSKTVVQREEKGEPEAIFVDLEVVRMKLLG